jgi:putative tryptophan/tyrosine transport system substrate-binding protein
MPVPIFPLPVGCQLRYFKEFRRGTFGEGHMQRRVFITLLGGTAVAWPSVARAQQPGKLPTVGLLGSGTPASQGKWAAFQQRLHELGWIEGRTVAIEVRWAGGRRDRFAEIAAEFVGLKVNVIVTAGTEPAIAARDVTSVIPIVFAGAGDPVGAGLVASLARPGGNVTGLSLQQTDTVGKRLELMREFVPGLHRLAVMAVSNASNAIETREVRTVAGTLGFEIISIPEIQRADDIVLAFEALRSRADALYVCSDPLVNANRVRINTLALAARLPTMHSFREYVEAGGLMSYGPNYPDLFRRAGEYVDKVLRGAMPADIPVEQPTKFDLVINLTTAKALGLDIPAALIARADAVIEE